MSADVAVSVGWFCLGVGFGVLLGLVAALRPLMSALRRLQSPSSAKLGTIVSGVMPEVRLYTGEPPFAGSSPAQFERDRLAGGPGEDDDAAAGNIVDPGPFVDADDDDLEGELRWKT